MSSTSPLVLVTGGSGFIGIAVIQNALKVGYRVRAAVRREAAAQAIANAPGMNTHTANDALTFVTVPDNTVEGAYLEAVKDCEYIIHLASPIATQPGDLVPQALAGNSAILAAAESNPAIKRLVITSSVAAAHTLANVVSAEQPVVALENDSAFARYVQSKTAAAHQIHAYAAKHTQRHFSIVNMYPGWVLGVNPLAKTRYDALNGSNMTLGWLFLPIKVNAMFGVSEDEPPLPVVSGSVHVLDVAEGHVKALDVEKVPGDYQHFVMESNSPHGAMWADAIDIVKKHFPHEVKDGKIPIAYEPGTDVITFDGTALEKQVLARPYKDFEEQVKDFVGWFLTLPE